MSPLNGRKYNILLTSDQVAEIEQILNSGELKKYLSNCARIKFKLPNNATYTHEDLVSFAMTTILEKCGDFEGKSKFTTWAFTILKFKFLELNRTVKNNNKRHQDAIFENEDGEKIEIEFSDENSKSCDKFIESLEANAIYKKAIDECFDDSPQECKTSFAMLMAGHTLKNSKADSGVSISTLSKRYKTFLQCIFGKLSSHNITFEDLT